MDAERPVKTMDAERPVKTMDAVSRLRYPKRQRLTWLPALKAAMAAEGYVMLAEPFTKKEPFPCRCPAGHATTSRQLTFMAGRRCRFCAPRPKLTREQRNERIAAALAEQGAVALSFPERAPDKFPVRCRAGHVTERTFPNVVHTKGRCRVCSGVPERHATPWQERLQCVLDEKGYAALTCPTGVDKPFAMLCSRGHETRPRPAAILAGRGCRTCAGFNERHATPWRDRLTLRLAEMGCAAVSEPMSIDEPFDMLCSEGHRTSPRPSSLLWGRGCYDCADSSFDPHAPTRLYYVRLDQPDRTRWKVGISNRTIEKRFGGGDRFIMQTLLDVEFSLGAFAKGLEQRILGEFDSERYRGPPILEKEGNRELFERDVLGLDPAIAQFEGGRNIFETVQMVLDNQPQG